MIVTSSLSTSTRRLKTASAISSWLPVPSLHRMDARQEVGDARDAQRRCKRPRSVPRSAPLSELRRGRAVGAPAVGAAADAAAEAGGAADGDAGVPEHAAAISVSAARTAGKRGFIVSSSSRSPCTGNCSRILQPDCACVNLLQYQ